MENRTKENGFPIASIIISGIIILAELSWLGKSSLALPLIGLAISNLLLGIHLLKK